MYEIFEKLCAKYGITPYKFCKETGVRTSTISSWKKKDSLVRPELARKICDYFKISMDYLMTGKEEPDASDNNLISVNDRDIGKKIEAVLSEIHSVDENPLYYNGEKIDDKSLAVLETILLGAMKQMDILKGKDK